MLTCELAPGKNPGSYRTAEASGLLRELDIEENVVQLGSVPYSALHHLYRSCDIYVTAAYTETFAHPIVEAMSSGLPVVASDLAVHREITGGAGLFFAPFLAEDLAGKVMQLATSPQLMTQLREKGLHQSASFSWETHVTSLLKIASDLRDGITHSSQVKD